MSEKIWLSINMPSKNRKSRKPLIIASFSIILCAAIYFCLDAFLQDDIICNNCEEKLSVEELVTNLRQDDPRILEYIRKHHLSPPSSSDYNLDRPNEDGGELVGVAPIIKKILNYKRNGFFIEAGSNDGESLSSTLGFERFYKWTGLCVEPSPLNLLNWRKKNRKAWLANVCLSPASVPMAMDFFHNFNDPMGSKIGQIEEIANIKTSEQNWQKFNVSCFPIFSLLKALKVDEVDYFNLDVEGVEFDVLKTIPFDQILIRTISVEMHEQSHEERIDLAKKINNLLETHNYILVKDEYPEHVDLIFAHNSTGYKNKMMN